MYKKITKAHKSPQKMQNQDIRRGTNTMLYEHIKSAVITDPDDAFESMLTAVQTYYQFYNAGISDIDVFRVDTRAIFDLMHYVFYELYKLDPDADTLDDNQKKEVEELMANMRFVRDHALSVQPELAEECTKRAAAVRVFIEDRIKDQENLKQQMERMSDSLEQLTRTLNAQLGAPAPVPTPPIVEQSPSRPTRDAIDALLEEYTVAV